MIKKIILYTLLEIACLLGNIDTHAQAENVPVILELEEGMVGADFEETQTMGGTYLTITTNGTAGNPESADRIITVEATFPAAQDYDLYLRCRVGDGAFEDDSFFYGADFGEIPVTSDNDWIRVNNIYAVGYAGDSQFVDGEGVAATGIWKWINLSEFTMDEPPVVFTVEEGNLTQTFQIGAREDGLDFDKIAFARADYFYTVSNLDNGEAGSPTMGGGGADMVPIAEGKDKFLGNVYSQTQKVGFTNYWNQVTPENAGKWGSVEAVRDIMNWTELDSAYALAKDNDFPYRHHVMIWGNQQPSWIENLSTSEQREEIEEWFAAVAERYPDIDFVEVVNEPLHDPPNSPGSGGGNYIEALGGSGSTGWDWIIESFELAREHFPNAELMINDYSIVNNTSSTDQYIEIIELLMAEGLIDQIGVQAHAFSTGGSLTTMENNLNALAETGLPVYVTELDIDGPSDQVQLTDYQDIFPLFWEHPAVPGITLWGFRPGMWRTDQGAFLIEEDGVTERPALIWLRNYVMMLLNTNNIAPSDHITVYPNPATTIASLQIEGMDDLQQAEIFDINGRKVWTIEQETNVLELDGGLAPGMYMLLLYDDQHAYAKKLLIHE